MSRHSWKGESLAKRKSIKQEARAAGPSRRVNFSAAFAGTLVLGLGIRVAMICLSPRYGYIQDHDDLARWALQAADEGVFSLYDHPPKAAELQVWIGDQWAIGRHELDRLCNYPPLCVYLLDISGHLLKGLRPDRLLNTMESRWAVGFWSLLFDGWLALGCAALVRAASGGESARRWALIGAWLAPPFWLVSCLWGQVDTWVLAAMVWTVVALVEGKWISAGLCYAVAIGLKPQAAALIPVWGAAVVMSRPFVKPIIAGAVAAGATVIIAGPFILHSGGAWWVQSYQANLFEHSKGNTTLMAFNPWYLDCLVTGSVDEGRTWLGVAKSTWGQAGLAVALVMALAWTIQRFKDDRRGLIPYSALVMLAFVMVPTRVHERFIVLVLPFVLAWSLAQWRGWIGLSLLLIVATAQTSWPQWLGTSAVDWEPFEKEQRAEFEKMSRQVPPDKRPADFESYIRPYREDYGRRNAPKRPFEWLFAILGVGGGIMATIETVGSSRRRDS